MMATEDSDTGTGRPPDGQPLAHWRQQVAQRPGPALLVDRTQRVIEANEAAIAAGALAGQTLAQALAELGDQRDRGEAGAVLTLRAWAVRGDDFDGWLVEAGEPEPAPQAERAISRRLADANVRLQEEIRRRRALERQMLGAAEQEKRRLALELHDGLGQHLAGVAFVARGLADAVHAGRTPEATEVDWLRRLINEAVARTRSLARGLWPASLERGSLGDAIRRFAEDLESIYGVSCTVQIDCEPQFASPAAAYHIFRIVQEASNNALRHGRARRLEFRIERLGEEVEISVLNDGATPAPEQLDSAQGIGVAGMRLRADAIGAALSIEPRPAGGVEVCLRLPAAQSTPDADQEASP